MPLVNVTVNNRIYTVACDEGEEERLHELAAIVDAKVQEAAQSVGQVGDMRLILMAALLMADDLTSGAESSSRTAEPGISEMAIPIMERAAARIEDIAARLSAA
jgi:cell division protein ZapA